MSNSVISECWKRRLHAVFRRSQKSFACGPYLAATEWEDRKRSRWFNLWSFEFSSFQSCASLHFFSRISHCLVLNALPLVVFWGWPEVSLSLYYLELLSRSQFSLSRPIVNMFCLTCTTWTLLSITISIGFLNIGYADRFGRPPWRAQTARIGRMTRWSFRNRGFFRYA